MDKAQRTEVEGLAKILTENVAGARAVAIKVGTEFRNFGLHNYAGRYNFDTALSMIFPYHFWHSRTSTNQVRQHVSAPLPLYILHSQPQLQD